MRVGRECFFNRRTHPNASSFDPRVVQVPFLNSTDPTAICSCGWSWWCFHPVPWKAHPSVAPHHGMRSTAVFRRGGSFLRWHASMRSDGGARAVVRTKRARQLPPCQLRRVGLSHRRFDLRSRSIRFFSIPFVKLSMISSHRLDPVLSHRSFELAPTFEFKPVPRGVLVDPRSSPALSPLPFLSSSPSEPTHRGGPRPPPRCLAFVRRLTPLSTPPPPSGLPRVNLPGPTGTRGTRRQTDPKSRDEVSFVVCRICSHTSYVARARACARSTPCLEKARKDWLGKVPRARWAEKEKETRKKPCRAPCVQDCSSPLDVSIACSR